MPAEEIVERWQSALIGDRGDVDLGGRLQQLGGEMRRRAVAGMTVAQLARFCPRHRDQIGHRLDLRVGAHQREVRRIGDERDRREIGEYVVGQLRIEERRDRVAARDHDQRVAVGRSLRRGILRNRPAGAGPVLDDDRRAAPALGELVAKRARHDVDGPARRERHQEMHGTRRVGVLRERCRAKRDEPKRRGRGKRNAAPSRPPNPPSHDNLPKREPSRTTAFKYGPARLCKQNHGALAVDRCGLGRNPGRAIQWA